MNRTVLGNVGYVRAARGLTDQQVFDLVEDGQLLWVFNFARKASRQRELRFWLAEIGDPKQVAQLGIEDVLARILPQARNSFGTFDINLLLSLSKITAWRLARALGKRDSLDNWRVERRVLADFLRQRWIGGNQ
jgi:hypothetical protein